MKTCQTLVFCACLSAASTIAAVVEPPSTYYVSPTGHDAQPGTLDQPFATIERATKAVRSRKEQGISDDLRVVLRAGTYPLQKTLQLTADDGGSQEHSVIYEAYSGEQVVVSGGRVISGWELGDDGLWVAELPEVRDGGWFFRQLYAEGERLPRARYPEAGFLKIKAVSPDHKTLEFTTPLPDRDLGGQDTEVVVVQNWSVSRERISRSAARGLTAETPIGWVGHSHCLPKPGMSVFLEHSKSFIQQPGQWYLDRNAGRLFYQAAEGEDPNQRQFVAPVLEQLLKVEGTWDRPVRNLEFRDLSFEHASFELPQIGYGGIQACYFGTTVEEAVTFAAPVALEWVNVDGCRLVGCRVQRVGASGVGLGAGCRNNQIVGCEFRDVGGTGVNVGHMRVKNPLWADWEDPRAVPANNEIANCVIQHCGRELWGGHGVFDAMTRETRIRNNEIAWLPYGGIATGYVWGTQRTSQQNCLIEYNHIYEVMLKLNDSGCIYTLGFQPGSIIQSNLMHGVRFGGFAGGQVCNNGIFFDEGSKGFLLQGNVIYDVDQEKGAKNTAVRFNRSHRDWQIWIDNEIGISDEMPEAAKSLIGKVGLEPQYGDLREQ